MRVTCAKFAQVPWMEKWVRSKMGPTVHNNRLKTISVMSPIWLKLLAPHYAKLLTPTGVGKTKTRVTKLVRGENRIEVK